MAEKSAAMKKKPDEIAAAQVELKFASFMSKEIFNKATERKKGISDTELAQYEKISLEKVPSDWRRFLSGVIESATTPRHVMPLDDYVKMAMAKRPQLVKKPVDLESLVRQMVATKVPGMPRLSEGAVKSALDLAAIMEIRKVDRFDLKGWTEGKAVV